MLPVIVPQLCSPVDVVPTEEEFVAEKKWNGWRVLGLVDQEEVSLRTRAGNPILSLPYLLEALAKLPAGTVLDGEIIDSTQLDGGWNRVQSLCSAEARHLPSPLDPPLQIVVFDLLIEAGEDIRDQPWSARRERLERLLASGPEGLCLSELMRPSQALLDRVLAEGYEGLVVKRTNAPYVGGKSGAWVKLKPEADLQAEVVITGFTEGKGRLHGRIGSICFRLPSGATGQCSGLNDPQRADFTANQEKYIGTVIEVAHWGVGESGRLKHPQFRRLRPDRSATELGGATSIHLRPAPAPAPASKPARVAPRVAKSKASKGRTRNYGAMGDAKLLAAYRSLRDKSGDAYDRCKHGGSGDPEADLELAGQIINSRKHLSLPV